MRFLLSINTIEAGSGGAQRVVALLCDELANQGHDVMLILYNPLTDHDYYISDKVKKVVLDRENKQNKVTYYLGKFLRLRQYVEEFVPDAIIPFLADQTLYLYLATRGTKFHNRIITTVRNNPKIFPKSRKLRVQNNILIALSKANFVQNIEQKEYFPTFIQKKTFVLPNPVSDELLEVRRMPTEIKNIVTLGRLSEQKNHEMLIKAFCMVASRHKNIRLNIYGQGELRSYLQSLIDTSEFKDRIRLCGVSTNVKDVLQANELFVLTSNYEGMPNALIEAMATGMPCISTDCPTGPADLINEQNGILVNMGDVEMCASAMEKMIEDNASAWMMGQRAQETISQKYQRKKITGEFVSFCKEYLKT